HEVPDLLATVLRDVVRTASTAMGTAPERVVLTCPPAWGAVRRSKFDLVPGLAGVPDAVVVTEPDAVAAYYATHPASAPRWADGDVVAAYDLGGGTFDATVLRRQPGGVQILGTPEGVERLGGMDFDESVLAFVNGSSGGALHELDLRDPHTTLALARLRHDCISAKEALTTDTETVLSALLPTGHFDVRLTREEFEGLVRAPIESTIGALNGTLRSGRIAPDQLAAVLLLGGSSRIPLVARMVREELGRPVVDTQKHVVALGAAALAGAVVAAEGQEVRLVGPRPPAPPTPFPAAAPPTPPTPIPAPAPQPPPLGPPGSLAAAPPAPLTGPAPEPGRAAPPALPWSSGPYPAQPPGPAGPPGSYPPGRPYPPPGPPGRYPPGPPGQYPDPRRQRPHPGPASRQGPPPRPQPLYQPPPWQPPPGPGSNGPTGWPGAPSADPAADARRRLLLVAIVVGAAVVAALLCYLVITAMRASSAAEGAPASPIPPAARVVPGRSL
ncbi:MAG TPA: Hsp70 family protein, partial [Pseudonocardia sp.]|nr:Hsp70 family protein [Pseudonocardia sp.]